MKGEGLAPYLIKAAVKLGKQGLLHLAEKAQGEMELVIWSPTCSGQSRAEAVDGFFYFFRQVNGNKESGHGLRFFRVAGHGLLIGLYGTNIDFQVLME
jgi:hypothetical protein